MRGDGGGEEEGEVSDGEDVWEAMEKVGDSTGRSECINFEPNSTFSVCVCVCVCVCCRA